MKKKFILLYSAIFLCTSLFAFEDSTFSGYLGLLADAPAKKELYSEGFVAGQLDFGGKIIFRGEVQLQTDDLLETSPLKRKEDLNTVLNLNELSATYTYNHTASTHFFSAYLGNFEGAGSDIFLQRQFGIKSIASPLTESYKGLGTSPFNEQYGAGIAYTVKFASPLAAGVYITVNKDNATGDEKKAVWTNLRFAGSYPYVTFDINGGINFPMEKESESGDKVIFLVKYLVVDGGANLLIGNRYTTSLFLQGGVKNIVINSDDTSKSNIDKGSAYFLSEMRMVFPSMQLNATLFSIPDEYFSEMVFFRHQAIEAMNKATEAPRAADEDSYSTLGFDANLFTESIYLGSRPTTLGAHFTVTTPGWGLFDALEDLKKKNHEFTKCDKTFVLSPYISTPLLSGNLTGIVSLNVTALKDKDREKREAFRFLLGYKAQL
ncbi:MAG: hypothetical protein II397_09655 [Treponema sp.]|nr:hypothetical protein [Treponema sp.]